MPLQISNTLEWGLPLDHLPVCSSGALWSTFLHLHVSASSGVRPFLSPFFRGLVERQRRLAWSCCCRIVAVITRRNYPPTTTTTTSPQASTSSVRVVSSIRYWTSTTFSVVFSKGLGYFLILFHPTTYRNSTTFVSLIPDNLSTPPSPFHALLLLWSGTWSPPSSLHLLDSVDCGFPQNANQFSHL